VAGLTFGRVDLPGQQVFQCLAQRREVQTPLGQLVNGLSGHVLLPVAEPRERPVGRHVRAAIEKIGGIVTSRRPSVTIIVVWMAIAATMLAFRFRSTLAGFLFVPYLAWVSFAAVLNFTIWRFNA
jgi:hypothetical protein